MFGTKRARLGSFVAVAGTILKLFASVRGGTTINQLGRDGVTVLYYAHLDHCGLIPLVVAKGMRAPYAALGVWCDAARFGRVAAKLP